MLTEISPPTLVAEGTRIRGDFVFVSATQVYGIVEGNIDQQSLEQVQIGRTGWIHGSITSRGPVVVEGKVEGDIHSTTRVRLLPTAIVSGAIKAPHVDIRAGAMFEGQVEMGARRKAA